MAITRGNFTSGTSTTSAATTTLAAHTCAASSNFLLVRVGWNNHAGDAPQSVTGITYDGDALTKIGHVVIADDGRCEMWYLANPTTSSSANVVVTWNTAGSGNFAGRVISAVDMSGVDTADPHGAFASETEGDASIAVTSAVDDVVFDILGIENGDADVITSAGANQTEEDVRENIGTDSYSVGFSYETATGASTTMSWTIDTVNADHLSHCGVAIQPGESNQTLSATANVIAAIAAAAALLAGTVTLAATANVVALSAPTALAGQEQAVTANVLAVSAPDVVYVQVPAMETGALALSAPDITAVAGEATVEVGANVISLSAPVAVPTLVVAATDGGTTVALSAPEASLSPGASSVLVEAALLALSGGEASALGGATTIEATSPAVAISAPDAITTVFASASANVLALSAPDAVTVPGDVTVAVSPTVLALSVSSETVLFQPPPGGATVLREANTGAVSSNKEANTGAVLDGELAANTGAFGNG